MHFHVILSPHMSALLLNVGLSTKKVTVGEGVFALKAKSA
jgi:hypothetical protein